MLPTFYILGAQKAGTTWLAAMLRQHPEIFMPRQKELHYFNDEARFARGPGWYAGQFAEAGSARALGEATPNYLAINTVKGRRMLDRLRALTPDARFIVVLRDPVARAFSGMLHTARKGRLPFWTDFDRAFENLLNQGPDPWEVLSMGQYDVQLDEYFHAFPRSRFRVLVYEEDIVARRSETLRSLCTFLDVGEMPVVQNENRQFNVGIKSRTGLALAQLVPWKFGVALGRAVERAGLGSRITLSAATIHALDTYYAPTRSRLERLLGRDLSCWRRSPPAAPASIVTPAQPPGISETQGTSHSRGGALTAS